MAKFCYWITKLGRPTTGATCTYNIKKQNMYFRHNVRILEELPRRKSMKSKVFDEREVRSRARSVTVRMVG